MSDALLQPALYGENTLSPGAVPHLLGGRCRCGHTFYPWQAYGCEVCGASGDALAPEAFAGTGTLQASAVVHLHAAPSPAAPFMVGTIRLDAGVTIRALIDEAASGRLVAGSRVHACLVPVPQPDAAGTAAASPPRDLRFRTGAPQETA